MHGKKQSVRPKAGKHLFWLFLLVLTGLLLTRTASQTAIAQEDPSYNHGDLGFEPPLNTDPYAILTGMRETLDELLAGRLPQKQLPPIRQMRKWTDIALSRYIDMDSDVIGTTAALGKVAKQAETFLRNARGCTDETCLAVIELREAAMLLSSHFAESWLIQARGIDGFKPRLLTKANSSFDKGLAFQNDDKYGKAIPEMVKTLKSVGNGWVFDVDVFEQNILITFTPEVVGFSYAINRNGKLAAADGVGLARTGADGGNVFQSETKEMNVASMTKTITAAQVLLFMQNSNVDVDDQIGPYMPWDWTLGDGVAELTFRHLLTHRSGINNNVVCATDLASLQTCFAADITLPASPHPDYLTDVYTSFYNNANFAIFRVIYKFITGECSVFDPCSATTDSNTSNVYRYAVQCDIFVRMGLSQPDNNPGCPGPDMMPLDTNPTLFYGLPGELLNGVNAGDWTNLGGGGGWYLSAVEMAHFLADLRYDKNIMLKSTRDDMYGSFMGFTTPELNAARTQGLYGIYRPHGGALWWPPPFNNRPFTQYHFSCLYDFGGGIQAVIMINGMQVTDRCMGLKAAYEAAWVAK